LINKNRSLGLDELVDKNRLICLRVKSRYKILDIARIKFNLRSLVCPLWASFSKQKYLEREDGSVIYLFFDILRV